MRRTRTAMIGAALAATGGTAAVRAVRRWARADLHGRAALVTGGSRGLGLLIARELGRCGCRVAIAASDPAELDRAAEFLRPETPEVVTLPADLADAGEARDMVTEAADRLGGLDVVVNNAGVMRVGPYGSQTTASLHEAMDVMFWAPYHVTAAALPYLRRSTTARLVMVSSVGGRISVPHLLPYSAAKFAVAGLSEGLHAELAAQGVRVTTVVPGLMRTGSQMNAQFTGDAVAEYGWFGLSAAAPLISMDAERAARRIVSAAREGRADLVLTPAAHLGILAKAVAPGLTARAMALANRALPNGEANEAPIRGRTADARLDSKTFEKATRLGRDAAHRFNQLPPRGGGS